MIRQTKALIKKVIFKFIKPPIQTVHVSNTYSQAGEDTILTFLFNSLGISHPQYVDIGANRPDVSSNSYLFYLRGSTGVCIEPDINLFKKFVAARPTDTCLNVAIGNSNLSELDFYVFDEPSVNTLSFKDAQERMIGGEFKHIDTIKVPIVKLEKVIEDNCNNLPDFISLDIEGVDYEVLSTFDFKKYPIPVWIVETIDYSPSYKKVKNNQILDFMLSKDYFIYADTYINTIFVLKSWFENFNLKIQNN